MTIYYKLPEGSLPGVSFVDGIKIIPAGWYKVYTKEDKPIYELESTVEHEYTKDRNVVVDGYPCKWFDAFDYAKCSAVITGDTIAIDVEDKPNIKTVNVESANGEPLGKASYIPMPGFDGPVNRNIVDKVIDFLDDEPNPLRYAVIEMWENLPEPVFVGIDIEHNDQSMFTGDLELAKAACTNNCQDGYILDFNTMRIMKPE
jgi:hypothetical protein